MESCELGVCTKPAGPGECRLRPWRDGKRKLKDELGMCGDTEHREGQGPAFGRDPAWKSKTQGPRRGVPRGGAAGRASTSKMLFSLQGPHRGASHAGPERPSCSLRVTKGPGATAEPHRAARAQHTLDSAIFTAGEGAGREVVSGSKCAPQHARAAPPR